MKELSPGDAILKLIGNATNRIIIVAPYIKSATLRHLLKKIPKTVSKLVCVTRWLPEDILLGVCDFEVFDDIMQVQGGQLLVHPHLHAKYYSNGQTTLVGSANLTSRGLGWNTPTNVELLVELPANSPELLDWESKLLNSSVEASESLRKQLLAQAEEYQKKNELVHQVPEVGIESEEGKQNILWTPQCPVPERLWEVYHGQGADTMVRSAFKAAKDDLAGLSLPPGLTNKDLFTSYVAGILQQMPLFMEISRLTVNGLTDTKAHEFLSGHFSSDKTENVNNVDQIWHILKLWIIFFFPRSFRIETDQEVLVMGQEIVVNNHHM